MTKTPLLIGVSLALGLFDTTIEATPCTDLTAPTGQPGWVLVSSPGVATPKTPVNVTQNAGWSLIPGSSWISVDASRGNKAGDYTYEFIFCVCNPGDRHTLNLSFLADNGAKVLLNGTQIFATTGNKNFTGTPLTVNSGGPFLTGKNSIRIVVSNEGSVTGLDAVLKMSSATSATADLTAATGQSGWVLVSSPGVTTAKTPVNVGQYAGWSLIPGTSWISVDAKQGSLAGDYTYEFKFCVCNPDQSRALTLALLADNGARVLVNGKQVFATTGDKNFTGTPKTVTYNGPFLSGENSIRVVVANEGSVTGLDALLKITGAAAGPCN